MLILGSAFFHVNVASMQVHSKPVDLWIVEM